MANKANKQNPQVENLSAAVSVTMTKDDTAQLNLTGFWTTRLVGDVDDEMRGLETKPYKYVSVNLTNMRGLDTAGAWIVHRTVKSLAKSGATISYSGMTSEHQILMDAVANAPDPDTGKAANLNASLFSTLFEKLGRAMASTGTDFLMSMHMLGSTVRGAQMKLGRGHGISPAAIVHQIERMGIGAFPVVILMSSIIGAIIAQQGAFQLRFFGAEIFVVDLVGVLVLREIGVLLTAIMVAGRSGSAITAEIGSMKMREEVDALTVIGLNPVGVLVFPRLVALVIALPLLTIVSDLTALFGASMVTWAYSGIPPAAFIARLQEAIDLSTYFAGLIKAPFMAMIIGIMASVEGMKVGGSAESLGTHVTASVVKSIFVVIVVDGLFAMFYAAINF